MKKIFTLILSIIAFATLAQSPVSTRQLRFFSVNAASDTAATVANSGRVWYDFVTDQYRANRNGVNGFLGSGSSGGITTADNALTVTGSNVQFDGNLIKNTTIGGAFNLDYTMSAHRINSGTLQIWNPSRTFSYTIDGGALATNRTLTLPVTNGTRTVLAGSGMSANRMPYAANGTGELSFSSTFTFDGTNLTVPNLTSTGRGIFTSTATLPGLNVGSVAGVPSTLIDGDIWYNSTSGIFQWRTAGVTGTIGRLNISSPVSTEIPISNGSSTNLIGSTLFSPSAGNLTLGSASTGGSTRIIASQGTLSNHDIQMSPKGTGKFRFTKPAITEGTNEAMGVATLVAGTILVNNNLVTANTRIFLTVQTPGGTQGFLSVSRSAGTSFTINSTSLTETSTVAWLLIEPN